MQKITTGSLAAILLIPATLSFAQFKSPEKVAKNLRNLETVLNRATQQAVRGRPVVPVKPGIVPGDKVGLLRVKMPTKITPVSKSYATLLQQIAAVKASAFYATEQHVAPLVAHEWARNKNRVLYEDQNRLARDLDSFYQGNADTYVGGGWEYKLYMLPVDGILYKPAGYEYPVVLNSREYFVIYHVKTKTGQIAKNIPTVHNLFQPKVSSSAAEFSGMNKLQERYRYMQQIRRNNTYGQAWAAFYRGDMQAMPVSVALCKFYTLHPELLHTAMTQIVEKSTGKKFLVLEPVLDNLGASNVTGQVFLYSLDEPGKEGVALDRAALLDHPDAYEVTE